MKGSAKQVKWAEDIKAAAFAKIAAMKKDRERYDAYEGRNNDLYPVTWEAIEAVEAELEDLFPQIDDARMIIEVRDRLTPSAIFKQVCDWQKYNS